MSGLDPAGRRRRAERRRLLRAAEARRPQVGIGFGDNWRCYARFFSPERYYALGQFLENVTDINRAKRLVRKIAHYEQTKQLPMKYCCFMVRSVVLDSQDDLLASGRRVAAVADPRRAAFSGHGRLDLHASPQHQRQFLLFYQALHTASETPIYQIAPEFCLV